MNKRFPITKAQFYAWLAAKPRARCDTGRITCERPIANAVFELTDEKMSSVQVPSYDAPAWVHHAVNKIDGGIDSDGPVDQRWHWTRGRILKLLQGGS